MKLLVSACLLGAPCRYDGRAVPQPAVLALAKEHTLIPVCPEQLGGLPTPRPPAERRGTQVVTEAGCDVTAAYRQGAAVVCELARLLGCEAAILKEKSPSCGVRLCYDGSFSGTLRAGQGSTTEALERLGLPVFSEKMLPELEVFVTERKNGSNPR